MDWPFLPIDSWADAADLATIVSLMLAVVAAVIAGVQIVEQLKGARRESAFQVFLSFTERFRAISELRRTLNWRFDAGDKTVNAEAIYNFYSQYWNQQVSQWEMFRAGLFPAEIYATWLAFTHDNIHGPFALHYFEGPRKTASISSAEAFVTVGKRRVLRWNPEALRFFENLAAIPHGWTPEAKFEIFEEPDRERRLEAIRALLARHGAVYRKSKLWNLK